MTSMLQDVVNSGTAWQVRQMGFQLPAAGKTGTTSEYRDAWFVGYTPTLVAGVWVGYDRPRTIVAGGYAAQIAVPLWTRFMLAVTRHDKADMFDAPSGMVRVEIDRASGRRASEACRHTGQVNVEYFANGTEPLEMCPLHGVEALTALVATRSPVFSGPAVSGVSGSRASAQEQPAPEPSSADRVLTAAAVSPSRETSAAVPVKKKRGFWARVFRGRRDDQPAK